LSDFKTNEYANLIGGSLYEPQESNPMIGFRGASRYYSPLFLPAFRLECQAIKKVREEMGLKNLKVMVPFCRTVEEGKRVQEIMAENGLRRGMNGLEIYVMAEIPANIILADKFCQIFDGFSIGSNDLTQLTLGIDRDSGGTLKVAGISNEKNEAVKELIKSLIKTAKRYKRKVGICGQGPSDFPDFAEFLVEQGIDSLSLNPDTVLATTMAIAKKEKHLKRRSGLLGFLF
jgi:pyruvate,water dikinase